MPARLSTIKEFRDFQTRMAHMNRQHKAATQAIFARQEHILRRQTQNLTPYLRYFAIRQ